MARENDDEETEPGPLWQRLLWFAALWVGGILAVGIVAYGIRLVFVP